MLCAILESLDVWQNRVRVLPISSCEGFVYNVQDVQDTTFVHSFAGYASANTICTYKRTFNLISGNCVCAKR